MLYDKEKFDEMVEKIYRQNNENYEVSELIETAQSIEFDLFRQITFFNRHPEKKIQEIEK